MGPIVNGAYELLDGNLALRPDKINCAYVQRLCNPPVNVDIPGKIQTFHSMHLLEATKDVAEGEEFLVSYGDAYQTMHLQRESSKLSGDLSNDSMLNQENKSLLMANKILKRKSETEGEKLLRAEICSCSNKP